MNGLENLEIRTKPDQKVIFSRKKMDKVNLFEHNLI